MDSAFMRCSSCMPHVTGAAVVIALYYLYKHVKNKMKYETIPGPRGWPIIGNSASSFSHVTAFEHRDLYGEVSRLQFFRKELIILNSIHAMKEALLSEETGHLLANREKTFYASMFVPHSVAWRSPSDKNWEQQHTLLGNILNRVVDSRAIEKVTVMEIESLIALLNGELHGNVELNDYFLQSVCVTHMIVLTGKRYGYDSDIIKSMVLGVNESVKLLSRYELLLRKYPFIRYISSSVREMCNIIQGFWKIFHETAFYKSKDQYETQSQECCGVAFEFLTMQKKVDWLEDKYIMAALQDVGGAGINGSKESLTASFLIFVHYPEVQKRIQHEIDDIIGKDRNPCLRDRAFMPYTQAAILEILRYAPCMPLGGAHSAHSDVNFRTYRIPKNAVIIQNILRIHHDEKHWKNPSDFDPTRFLAENGDVLPVTDPVFDSFVPFVIGKRACLGDKFAKSRMFLYITCLLQKFTFKATENLPSCHPFAYKMGFPMKTPRYKVNIQKRE